MTLEQLVDQIETYAGNDPKKYDDVVKAARAKKAALQDRLEAEFRKEAAELAKRAKELGVALRARGPKKAEGAAK